MPLGIFPLLIPVGFKRAKTLMNCSIDPGSLFPKTTACDLSRELPKTFSTKAPISDHYGATLSCIKRTVSFFILHIIKPVAHLMKLECNTYSQFMSCFLSSHVCNHCLHAGFVKCHRGATETACMNASPVDRY